MEVRKASPPVRPSAPQEAEWRSREEERVVVRGHEGQAGERVDLVSVQL